MDKDVRNIAEAEYRSHFHLSSSRRETMDFSKGADRYSHWHQTDDMPKIVDVVCSKLVILLSQCQVDVLNIQ